MQADVLIMFGITQYYSKKSSSMIPICPDTYRLEISLVRIHLLLDEVHGTGIELWMLNQLQEEMRRS